MKVLCIVYDNGGYMHYFPIGIASIATVLKYAGHDVEIYSQDLHHYPEEHLTHHLDTNEYDIVCVGTVAGYYPYRKLLKISEAINKSMNRDRFSYVMGGHMVSAEPKYFLLKTGADFVVVGEGEKTILELIERKHDIISIAGLAYRVGDEAYVNAPRQLIQDLDTLPMIDYKLFPIEYYRLQRMPNIENTEFSMSILSGRGCTFQCTFCYRLMKGMRLRSIEAIVDEIKFLKKYYGITYFDFADDLTMESKKRSFALCEEFLRQDLNIKWRCEGRLNFVDKEVLSIMKQAGCTFINYGIESLDNQVLKNMRKGLTEEIIIKGIETTIASGISPGLNIIFGNIGDNEETLQKSVKFLLHYDDCSQVRSIRPVTPYPGCELYEEAKRRGIIKDAKDFYEVKHTNSDLLTVNFTDLSEKKFYECLYYANYLLLNNYNNKKKIAIEEQLNNLYHKKDTSFRGWRQT